MAAEAAQTVTFEIAADDLFRFAQMMDRERQHNLSGERQERKRGNDAIADSFANQARIAQGVLDVIAGQQLDELAAMVAGR